MYDENRIPSDHSTPAFNCLFRKALHVTTLFPSRLFFHAAPTTDRVLVLVRGMPKKHFFLFLPRLALQASLSLWIYLYIKTQGNTCFSYYSKKIFWFWAFFFLSIALERMATISVLATISAVLLKPTTLVFYRGKRRCRSLYWRVRAEIRRQVKGRSKSRCSFKYDPFSYALNFDDGGSAFICWPRNPKKKKNQV